MKYLFSGFLFAFFCLSFYSAFAQSSLRGKISDEQGEPLSDAVVVLKELKVGAQTNADGFYSIPKLNNGKYTLIAFYPGMDSLIQTVEIPSNRVVILDLVLKEKAVVLNTVEIVDQQMGQIDRIRSNTGLVKVTTQEIKLLPSLGTPDLSQYLQVLPGVIFTGDQGGQLFIRGGSPIQNLTLLDGAIIYNPFHTLGLFSIFDTDILRSVDVYSGGFSAEYGGRVSSVMDVKTRNGNFQKLSGKVLMNTVTAGALIEGPLFKKKGKSEAGASYLLSLRHCYLNHTSKALYPYVNDTKIDGKPLGLPFAFTDVFGKITLGSGSNQLSGMFFHQQDAVNYQYPSNYDWNSTGGGINFSFLPPNSAVIISGNVSASNYTNSQLSDTEKYPRKSSIGGFNSRLNFSYIFNSIDELAYGIQILGFTNNIRFSNSLGLETRQETFNTEMAAYVKYRKVFRVKQRSEDGIEKRFERLVIEPSLRLHYFNEFSQLMPEPRFRAKLNFNKISFQFATGMYSQNLTSSNSDRDVVVLFQGFLAAPENVASQKLDHPLQAAYHFLGGTQIEIIPNLETNIEGWYKKFTQITNINRDRIFPEDPTFIAETGEAYGFDVSLKYQYKNLYLYGTYGYAKVTRTDDKRTYAPVFDRRHNMNFVASYKMKDLKSADDRKILGNKWEFSLRWTLGTGFPFTQTQGLFEKVDFFANGSQTNIINQNGQLGVLLSDNYNGSRLPSYHRLDISIKYNLRLGKNGVLEINANAINLYSRENIFYFDRIRFQRVNQLPFVPTAGVSYSF